VWGFGGKRKRTSRRPDERSSSAPCDCLRFYPQLDQRIHSDQLFELTQAHACLSTVVPGHLCQDGGSGSNVFRPSSSARIEFPSVLGNTSRINKQQRTVLQLSRALLLTNGQQTPRDLAFYILPLLRDICLALVDPKTSDTMVATSSWLASPQRCQPLTSENLARACTQLAIDDEQMALLEEALLRHGGRITPAAYATLARLRAPATLMPYDDFCAHLSGTASTIKAWRHLLCAPPPTVDTDDAEPGAAPIATPPPSKIKPKAKGKSKTKEAPVSVADPVASGVKQVATFCAEHKIDKELFERLVTWLEFLLPPEQRFVKRIPTAQKTTLTLALKTAADTLSSELFRAADGKVIKLGAKRKLDDMLAAQSSAQDARLLAPEDDEEEQGGGSDNDQDQGQD
jgi:hypothetical protein